MIETATLGGPAGRWACAAPSAAERTAPAAGWLLLPHGQCYRLGHETRIGRGAGSDIILAHRWVSRTHAIIMWNGSDFVLTDAGSTHGTLINERPLASPHRLADGDRIWLCTTRLRFSSVPPARAHTMA